MMITDSTGASTALVLDRTAVTKAVERGYQAIEEMRRDAKALPARMETFEIFKMGTDAGRIGRELGELARDVEGAKQALAGAAAAQHPVARAGERMAGFGGALEGYAIAKHSFETARTPFFINDSLAAASNELEYALRILRSDQA